MRNARGAHRSHSAYICARGARESAARTGDEPAREPIACREPCKNMYCKQPPVQMNRQPPFAAQQKDERGVRRCFDGVQLTMDVSGGAVDRNRVLVRVRLTWAQKSFRAHARRPRKAKKKGDALAETVL
ncbi:unnamed protein product, partial [Iphiclides podalirius]